MHEYTHIIFILHMYIHRHKTHRTTHISCLSCSFRKISNTLLYKESLNKREKMKQNSVCSLAQLLCQIPP